jgi:hypothetical protein
LLALGSIEMDEHQADSKNDESHADFHDPDDGGDIPPGQRIVVKAIEEGTLER